MDTKDELEAFHKTLDDDKGLKSKRQMVTYVALITLALTLSGATITEANTFLFKLNFVQPEGLVALLFIANIFCYIRYRNYSERYRNTLNRIGQRRFLSDMRVKVANDEERCFYGILGDIYTDIYEDSDDEVNYIQYKKKWSIVPYLIVEFVNGIHGHDFIKKYNIFEEIGFCNYIKLILIEIHLKVKFMLSHREILDLMAPKIIAIVAFLSILLRDKLHFFTDLFLM